MLARAVIHTGLPPKRLLLRIFGYECTHQSMFLPTNVQELAEACRVQPDALLAQHTVFPFAAAFLPAEAVERLAQRAGPSAGSGPTSHGALSRSATFSTPGLRFCPHCAKEDRDALGESYWRRTHCLPAVHLCARHATRLHVAEPQPKTLSQCLLAPLPHRQREAPERTACREDRLLLLANAVQRTLEPGWSHRSDWLSRYRQLALEQQLALHTGSIAGARLAAGLRDFFGAAYLEELGCDFRDEVRAWPGLMVREGTGVTFGPVKHILLNAFLTSSEERSTVFVYQPPGKKATDLGELDARLAALVMKEAASLLQKGQTGTVTSLLQATGYWQTFRHKRKLLPLTSAQVAAFKETDSSERKSGGRHAHAKRLKAIAEGRQKPFKPWSPRGRRARTQEAP